MLNLKVVSRFCYGCQKHAFKTILIIEDKIKTKKKTFLNKVRLAAESKSKKQASYVQHKRKENAASFAVQDMSATFAFFRLQGTKRSPCVLFRRTVDQMIPLRGQINNFDAVVWHKSGGRVGFSVENCVSRIHWFGFRIRTILAWLAPEQKTKL